MPSIAKTEQEQEAYCLAMKAYLEQMRNMPEKDAVKKAKHDLEEAGIIDGSGELTERYAYSREHGKKIP